MESGSADFQSEREGNFEMFMKIFLAGAVTALGLSFGAVEAFAGEVLVSCSAIAPELGTAANMTARANSLMFSQNLQGRYDHIEFRPCGSRQDALQMGARLQKFGSQYRTDFIDLRSESAKAIGEKEFDRELSEQIRRLSVPKLRWVHLGALPVEEGRILAQRFSTAGAKTVTAFPASAPDAALRSFLAALFSRWSEGEWLSSCIEQASRASVQMMSEVGPWISGRSSSARLELFRQGLDVVRGSSQTRSFPMSLRAFLAPLQTVTFGPLSQESLTSTEEREGVQLSGAVMVPGLVLNPSMGGVSEFIERASGPAWDLLRSTFPNPVPDLPGRIDEEDPSGELSWIDGDGLRYFMSPIRDWLGSKTDAVLNGLLGLRLQKDESGLRTALHLKRAFKISLDEAGFSLPDGSLKSVHLPRTLRVGMRVQDGVVRARFLPVVGESLSFEVEWKGFPLNLTPVSLQADLATGAVALEATVLGGWVPFTARVNLYEKKFEGIDFWASIQKRLRKFGLPSLRFEEKR
jgi:hypothetical protein